MARLYARRSPHACVEAGATRNDAGYAQQSPTIASPPQQPSPDNASPWGQSPASPYLSNPEGFQYGQLAPGDPASLALPKYHFSLSWTKRGGTTDTGATQLAPSGPQQIDDVLFRLSVDRNGLRYAHTWCSSVRAVSAALHPFL